MRSQDPSQAQSHTLQVNDVFHKQQWLNCLRSAISVHRPLSEPSTPTPPGSDARSKRRPSSVSAIVHMEETDENCPQPTSQSAPSSPCSSTSSSPTTTSPSSSSSSTTSISSSTSPSPTSHKTKKDKKSLYSLGKRKETMVWSEVKGENGLLGGLFVYKCQKKQRGEAWDLYLCVYACVRIITTVFCVTVLFGSYLPYPSIRVHPAETQYSGEKCTASTSSKKGSIMRGKHTFHMWICVSWLLISWR